MFLISPPGFAMPDFTIHSGYRVSVADAYLRPTAQLKSDNLHVLTKAHAVKVSVQREAEGMLS